ncbi:MAG: hypothetical protein KGL39_26920 [Patescibacteria group bacterium]|nr:hypothetical protein [Patescibacteria group bacterium]
MTDQERQALQIGQWVRVRDDYGNEANWKVKYPPCQLSNGKWVIWLKGIPGCYLLSRVVSLVTVVDPRLMSGRVCAICQFREPPPDRSVCFKCMPAATQTETQSESVCAPNDFGLCSAHPACKYTRAVVTEYQIRLAAAKATWRNETQELRLLVEAQQKRINDLLKAIAKFVEPVKE